MSASYMIRTFVELHPGHGPVVQVRVLKRRQGRLFYLVPGGVCINVCCFEEILEQASFLFLHQEEDESGKRVNRRRFEDEEDNEDDR